MKFKINMSENAKLLVDSMNLRQLINQVLCPLNTSVDEKCMQEYGAMFFASAPYESLQQSISSFRGKCSIPPLIVSDFENGAGSMIVGATNFPSMMGCGQTNSEELLYEMGRVAALEGATLGFNWAFGPCVDISRNIDSPVVNFRSAGNDAGHVIKMTSTYIKGLQENGMMATAKHFPGDGFGRYDQHLTTPENPLDIGEWWETSGKVFKELIDMGVMAVMPGHISLPCYDEKDPVLGVYPPATLSSRLMTGLLKEELGFDGLIVSDAVCMGGFCGFMRYYEACARFLESGGDIILFPKVDEAFYMELEKLVRDGILREETLRQRAWRIISLKEQIGLLDSKNQKAISVDKINCKEFDEVSRKMVECSISLVRDRNSIIPFKIERSTRILHAVIHNDYDTYKNVFDAFTLEMKKYSDNVTEKVDYGSDNMFLDIYTDKFDIVICSIGQHIDWGINVARLHGTIARNMMNGWMKLGCPTIFVSHFDPFIHNEYDASVDTLINTYGNTKYTAEYLMRAITGQHTVSRRLISHS